MFGSTLIGEQYLNPDGSPRGYRGSKNKFGDWNGDNKVNYIDETKFIEALNKEYSGQPLTAREKDTFYVNCNGSVDVGEFYKLFVGTPTNPRRLNLGQIIMGLSLATAGSLVLKKRYLTKETSN